MRQSASLRGPACLLPCVCLQALAAPGCAPARRADPLAAPAPPRATQTDPKDDLSSVLPCEPPPQAPYASVAFDLDAWLRAHPERRPQRRTSQSGVADPVPFSPDLLTEVHDLRAAWDEVVGPIPASCVPLDPQEEPLGLTPDEAARLPPDLIVHRVSYRGAHGDRIPAFLLLPPMSAPAPAVIVIHQSQPTCGKKEPIGVCGAPNLAIARELAERGFVVLAPDSIGYGDRSSHYADTGSEYADAAPLLARFPAATLTGLRISDVRRGLAYLQGLPQVDRQRVGMMGHSNGALETLWTAAFTPEIRCAVVNAGPNLLRREILSFNSYRPGLARWAVFGYLPALGFFDADPAALPVEIHQLYALIAPRGLFVAQMEDDSIAPRYDRIDFAFAQGRAAFAVLGGRFDSDKIASGITPACSAEWGPSACVGTAYDRCARAQSGDAPEACRAPYVAAGIDPGCVGSSGGATECVHRRYVLECPERESDPAACLARLRAAGLPEPIDDACIAAGAATACRRDHGLYPSTKAAAYPFLDRCLRASDSI